MKYLIVCIGVWFVGMLSAQDTVIFRSQQPSKAKSAILDLSGSLQQNETDEVLADNYLRVAEGFVSEGDYSKSLPYFERSKELYQRLGNKEKQAYIERETAKVFELTEDYPSALGRYQKAFQLSSNPSFKEINLNDAMRLKNASNPVISANYIQSNINIAKNAGKNNERVFALQQMAQVNVALHDNEKALGNLQEALYEVKDDPLQSLQIERRIADVFVADSQVEKAIDIHERILESAKEKKDTKVQVKQLQNLSSSHRENRDQKKADSALREAYDLAVRGAHTYEARQILQQLTDLYTKENRQREALDLYADFTGRLDSIIQSDSTLMDSRFFQIHEERIARLELEREWTEELLRKKNIFNTVLMVCLFFILIFLLLLIRAFYSIKRQNKRIALQSLRREMNPHFIFNSLNSVNQFIAQRDELEANRYLTSYSRLMRTILEYSNKDFILFSAEIQHLKEYLELEHMRFREIFEYKIKVDPELENEDPLIPAMLIQPHLENAIWHGLRYKGEKGELVLSFYRKGKELIVTVIDNGIGLSQSRELKTRNQRSHVSRGIKNSFERITLLNDLYGCRIRLDISERTGEQTGVIVTFCFPLKVKDLWNG